MNGNYHYYTDGFGNEYRLYIDRQSDGKFHGMVCNSRSHKRKVIAYNKKVTVKKYLRRWANEAHERYNKSMKRRQDRQYTRDALKPDPKSNYAKSKVVREQIKVKEKQIKALKRKIKTDESWIKKHNTKIKYYKKRLETLK